MKNFDSNHYRSMLESGTLNLEAHCAEINNLNVFPIPDGDTGTNMVLTLKNGLRAIADASDALPVLCSDFATAIVLGARGNSGVILSQFFKGVSAVLAQHTCIDLPCFIAAFENGVRLAYDSVGHPVEGTILTVLKDSLDSLKENEARLSDFEEALDLICSTSKASLERTPELLPILKKAGVVDSGAAGMVYFFEGIRKQLNGEPILSEHALEANYVDYSAYNRKSTFEFGFCTEILLQLLDGREEFEYDAFRKMLKTLGGSLVFSREDDKLKIHIHTLFPEKVMLYCHRFGEFLSLKIENMTIQHNQTSQNFLRGEDSEDCSFSIVATAYDRLLQKTFSGMGADVAMLSSETPSSADFLEAFKLCYKKDILVFPNSANAVMSALQAAAIYESGNVTVLNSDSVAACYSFLAKIDFEQSDLSKIKEAFDREAENLTIIRIARATKDVEFDNQAITTDDFFAYCEKEILGIDSSLQALVSKVVKKTASVGDLAVICLFLGKAVSATEGECIAEHIRERIKDTEVVTIPTEDAVCHITLSLE